ncbi:uncharacterized protein LOC144180568 [Haemaphysalis longicornis]
MAIEEDIVKSLIGPEGETEALERRSGEHWQNLQRRWTHAVGRVFAEDVLPEATVIFYMRTGPVFPNLLSLITDRESDVVLVLGWLVAQYVSRYANHALMVNAFRTFTDPVVVYRWHCHALLRSHFGIATVARYGERHFTQEVREDIAALTLDIRRTFFETLTSASYEWASLDNVFSVLDRSLQQKVHYVVRSVPLIRGKFPEDLRNVEVHWKSDASTAADAEWAKVNPNHEVEFRLPIEPFFTSKNKKGEDTFSITPVMLRFPFYEIYAPDAIKLGALGADVAYFTARTYYQVVKGSFPSGVNAFRDCLGGTSSNLYREWTAASFEAARKVFAEASTRSRNATRSIKGLEHLSPRQLLYVSAMYRHCGDSPPQASEIKKTLGMLRDFHEAFSCPEGSKMRAASVCTLFP